MLQDGHKKNFDTILKAANSRDLALVDCQDATTGKQVATICAVFIDDDGQYNMVPLAKLFDGNPYDELNPPNPDGGYFGDNR